MILTLLRPWYFSFLCALLLGVGLSAALRGAGVGLDSWIEQIDLSAAFFTQLSAMISLSLCSQLTTNLFQHKRPLWLTALYFFFLQLLFFVLWSASWTSFYQVVLRWVLPLCLLATLPLFFFPRTLSASQKLLISSVTSFLGLHTASLFLPRTSSGAAWTALLPLLSFFLALLCALSSLFLLRIRLWERTGLLGLVALLTQTVEASRNYDSSAGVVLIGRTLHQLAIGNSPLPPALLSATCSLLLLVGFRACSSKQPAALGAITLLGLSFLLPPSALSLSVQLGALLLFTIIPPPPLEPTSGSPSSAPPSL